MYPLQLLTGNVPLSTILGMPAPTLQLATAGRKLTSTACPPTVSEMPAVPTRIKWQCHLSDWETITLRPEEAAGLDITPEEWPAKGRKRGNPWQSSSRRATGKPSGKTPNLSNQLGRPISKHTTPTMTMRGPTPSRRWPPPLGSDIHKVQQVWTGQKDLWVTHYVTKSSQKDIHFFWVLPPTELAKIMDLKGIHSPRV